MTNLLHYKSTIKYNIKIGIKFYIQWIQGTLTFWDKFQCSKVNKNKFSVKIT